MVDAVGSASVNVRPDFTGFRERLDFDLKKAFERKDQTIPVKADTALASAKLTGLQAQVLGITKRLGSMRARVDSSDATVKLDSLLLRADRLGDRLGDEKLDLKGTVSAQIALDRLNLAADRLQSKLDPSRLQQALTRAGRLGFIQPSLLGGAAAAAEIRGALAGGGAASGGEGAAGGGLIARIIGSKAALYAAGVSAAAAIVAGLIFKARQDLKSGWKAIAGDLPQWMSGIGGVIQLSATGWSNAILDHFNKPITRLMHDAGHSIANEFDRIRHDVAPVWDALWNNTAGRAERGQHDIAVKFDTWRHDIAATFDTIRHDTAAKWDQIWTETKSAVTTGIRDVVSFFKALPGKILGALFGLGHSLYAFGHAALNDLWSGIKSVAGGLLGWFAGFVGKILGFLRKLTGSSPSGAFYFAGQKMMTQLAAGIKSRAHTAADAAQRAMSGFHPGASHYGSRAAAIRFGRAHLPPGWSWSALYNLWQGESGWNPYAVNPSSGAYGIPQSLGHGHPYNLGDYANQIRWGLAYIASTYGSSQNAYSAWLSRSPHWYDKESLLPPPRRMAAGEPHHLGRAHYRDTASPLAHAGLMMVPLP